MYPALIWLSMWDRHYGALANRSVQSISSGGNSTHCSLCPVTSVPISMMITHRTTAARLTKRKLDLWRRETMIDCISSLWYITTTDPSGWPAYCREASMSWFYGKEYLIVRKKQNTRRNQWHTFWSRENWEKKKPRRSSVWLMPSRKNADAIGHGNKNVAFTIGC